MKTITLHILTLVRINFDSVWLCRRRSFEWKIWNRICLFPFSWSFLLVREIYHNFYDYGTLWHEKLNSRIFDKVPTSIWRISETKLAFQLPSSIWRKNQKKIVDFHRISHDFTKICKNTTQYSVHNVEKYYKTRSRSKISVKSTL